MQSDCVENATDLFDCMAFIVGVAECVKHFVDLISRTALAAVTRAKTGLTPVG